MLLTSSDTKRTLMDLVYKFHPKRTSFNVYAEYPQLQLTFLALQPYIKLKYITYKIKKCFQS